MLLSVQFEATQRSRHTEMEATNTHGVNWGPWGELGRSPGASSLPAGRPSSPPDYLGVRVQSSSAEAGVRVYEFTRVSSD